MHAVGSQAQVIKCTWCVIIQNNKDCDFLLNYILTAYLYIVYYTQFNTRFSNTAHVGSSSIRQHTCQEQQIVLADYPIIIMVL